MRCAILTLTQELFASFLQLPKGAEIVGVEADIHYRGVFKIKIQGAGWETKLGEEIRQAAIGTATRTGYLVQNVVIDWHLPKEE